MATRQANALDQDARVFYAALSRLVRAYQFRDRQRICYHGISVTQCYALSVLIHSGPMRLDALAGALYLDKSTASRALDGLEQRGYVRRGDDPDDGRAIRLEATPRGRSLHARIEEDLVREQAELVARFGPDVRAAAVAMIGAAADRAEAKFHSKTLPEQE